MDTDGIRQIHLQDQRSAAVAEATGLLEGVSAEMGGRFGHIRPGPITARIVEEMITVIGGSMELGTSPHCEHLDFRRPEPTVWFPGARRRVLHCIDVCAPEAVGDRILPVCCDGCGDRTELGSRLVLISPELSEAILSGLPPILLSLLYCGECERAEDRFTPRRVDHGQ